MLPTIVKIYNRSDFTVQLPLAEGYDGQEFRFTLYTCGEPENGWVASYIDGTYSNCTVNEDVVTIYVNNNNNMNPGCLTVRSEYDYFNGHFADNEDNVKDVYKTNIYLVDYKTNAFSASFRPSNMPDLTGTNEYVTFSDINAMSYITMDDVSACSYVTSDALDETLASYATETYVAEFVDEFVPKYDLSVYVTHDELNQASYAPRTLLMFKQDTLVSGQNIKTINNESLLGSGNLEVVTDLTGYATETYVANYFAGHIGDIDLSTYVSKSELSEMGYLDNQDVQNIISNASYVTSTELSSIGYITNQYFVESLSSASYVTKAELNNAGYISSIPSEYVTESELNSASYATKNYVIEYVAQHAPTQDLSAYVTHTQLNNAGYISSIPSEYLTEGELSGMGYATQTYVANYVAQHAPTPDLSAYVTKTELNNASYVTHAELSSEGFTYTYELTQAEYDSLANKDPNTLYIITDVDVADLTYYATKSYVANYVSTYGGSNVDLSAYVTKTELSNAGYITVGDVSQMGYITSGDVASMGYITSIPNEYVTDNELSSIGYATQTYVANYVSTYAPTPDLSAYVTKTELSNAGYVTGGEISSMGYATQTYVADYVGTYGGGTASVYTLTYAQYQDLVNNNTYDPNTLYAISDGVPINLESYATKSYIAAYYVEISYLEAYYVPKTYIDTYYIAKSYLNYDSTTNTLTITI